MASVETGNRSERHGLTIVAFERNPAEKERDSRAEGVQALKTLSQKLPEKHQALVGESTRDYPVVSTDLCEGSWCARDNHFREVFCIDGTPYFRRYSDNWNPSVIVGSTVWPSTGKTTETVVWRTTIGDKALIDLVAGL